MTTYCTDQDLLLGEIPLPSYLSAEQIVQDAADEMDSLIGFVYKTPVVLPNDPASRPASLLLKRINSHLATGRLILQIASPQESAQLHAYGKSLVDESLSALQQIASGNVILTEDDTLLVTQTTPHPTGPIQYNKEASSMVDAFYDDIAFAEPTTVWLG